MYKKIGDRKRSMLAGDSVITNLTKNLYITLHKTPRHDSINEHNYCNYKSVRSVKKLLQRH